MFVLTLQKSFIACTSSDCVKLKALAAIFRMVLTTWEMFDECFYNEGSVSSAAFQHFMMTIIFLGPNTIVRHCIILNLFIHDNFYNNSTRFYRWRNRSRDDVSPRPQRLWLRELGFGPKCDWPSDHVLSTIPRCPFCFYVSCFFYSSWNYYINQGVCHLLTFYSIIRGT